MRSRLQIRRACVAGGVPAGRRVRRVSPAPRHRADTAARPGGIRPHGCSRLTKFVEAASRSAAKHRSPRGLRQAVAAKVAIDAVSPRGRPSPRRAGCWSSACDAVCHERGAAVTCAASTRHFDRGVRLYSRMSRSSPPNENSGYRHHQSAVAIEWRSPAITAMRPVIAAACESGYQLR
jgi:hypothetical protein